MNCHQEFGVMTRPSNERAKSSGKEPVSPSSLSSGLLGPVTASKITATSFVPALAWIAPGRCVT
jgi:hypothetical protein